MPAGHLPDLDREILLAPSILGLTMAPGFRAQITSRAVCGWIGFNRKNPARRKKTPSPRVHWTAHVPPIPLLSNTLIAANAKQG
jgi:hypothetical protein